MESSRLMLTSFKEARLACASELSLGVSVGEKRWTPPVKGAFRLDIDAVVNEEIDKYGVGAIVRDEHGKLRADLANPIQKPMSVLDAEINAILYGVGLCLQEGLGPIVVYSDSLLAVRLLNKEYGGENYMEKELPILADLVNSKVILGFHHMYRETNSVAHSLAHFGAGCMSMRIWNNIFPP